MNARRELDIHAERETSSHIRWYACYTRARHEKKVADLLSGRGIESYLPLVTRTSQWKDRRKQVQFPIFAGYVFARFEARAVHDVLAIPGISTIVRHAGRPAPIPDEDIENIKRLILALERSDIEPELGPYFAEGTLVRVKSGPFEGVTGRVVEVRGKRRVLVGLEAIGQGLELDVETTHVEAIEDFA